MAIISQGTFPIKFIQNSGSFNTYLISPDGDIYQNYIGESTSGLSFSPNFEVTPRRLNFVNVSSRTAENNANGLFNPDSVVWYANGTKLTFGDDDLSTNAFNGVTGHFKRITPGTNSNFHALSMVKNLAGDFGLAPVIIKGVGALYFGETPDYVEATYTIPIKPTTADKVSVHIVSDDGKGFLITEKGGSCTLRAEASNFAGDILPDALTYEWEQYNTEAWEKLSTTTQTLTVTGDMVASYGLFRVRVSKDGKEIGVDAQGVLDTSDPYILEPNPTPADSTIRESATEGQPGSYVTFNPKVKTKGGVDVTSQVTFTYFAHDAVGNEFGTSNTITKEMCMNTQGEIAMDIIANR